MKKLLASIAILSLLTACPGKPTLPDPTVTAQPIPEVLMKPPETLKTIPTGETLENRQETN